LAKAAALWRAGEGASLLILSGDEVRFYHQLIQEFFTARYLHDQPLTAALLVSVAETRFSEIWPLWVGLDQALVERLLPFLDDATPEARRAAATILGSLGDPRAGDPLVRALDDFDAGVRWSAALSLATLRDRRAAPFLIEGLRAADGDLRLLAARTLGDLADWGAERLANAVEPLIDILKRDESDSVRATAATALGALRDGRALYHVLLMRSSSRSVS
jgi:HEAT repeat protein